MTAARRKARRRRRAGAIAAAATLALSGSGAAETVARLLPLDLSPFAASLAAEDPATRERIAALVAASGIGAIRAEMAAGRLTAEALALWHLGRIARLDGRLRAYVSVNPDALAEARAADRARAAGRDLGPLHGIPLSVKDNIETAPPLRTTANSAALIDHVARGDATLVARLRAGGAVILGKASLSELAGVVTLPGAGAVAGQAVNPHGDFPTSGSSSGSAVGVAAGLAIASVGTETSGSLIAPAAHAGVVAVKPSHGLVPADGVLPLVARLDSAGPVAQSVADAAALLSVIAAVPALARISPGGAEGARIGLLRADIAAEAGSAGPLARAEAALRAAGAEPVDTALPGPPMVRDGIAALIAGGMRHETMPALAARGAPADDLEGLIAWMAADPARRAPFGMPYLEAFAPLAARIDRETHDGLGEALVRAARAALDRVFAETGAAALASLDNLHAPLYAVAGHPAVTLPLGLREGGQPVGLTLIGRAGGDAALLSLAAAIEAALPPRPVATLP